MNCGSRQIKGSPGLQGLSIDDMKRSLKTMGIKPKSKRADLCQQMVQAGLLSGGTPQLPPLTGTPNGNPFGLPQLPPIGTPNGNPFGLPQLPPIGTPTGLPQLPPIGTPTGLPQLPRIIANTGLPNI